MPLVPTILEIPASIHKAEIPVYAALQGSVNALAAFGHSPGTLRYVTFCGALNKASGKYEGHHLFDIGSFAGEPATDLLSKLPGLKPAAEKHDGI